MIKKFSNFINESSSTINKKVVEDVYANKTTKVISKPIIEKHEEIIVTETKESMDDVIFEGKIAKFPNNSKPSKSIILLENNKISKDKLHFIISEQTDSIILYKYNNDSKYKLNEFVNTFIDCHQTNPKISKLFLGITNEGTEHYAMIKNIPDIKLGEKKLINLISDDLIKLLK
ncbi:hypothetical protein M0Q50_04050 [bacterium]|jgi:hypothetical protein|nr:hypothetical protein [bacterium]